MDAHHHRRLRRHLHLPHPPRHILPPPLRRQTHPRAPLDGQGTESEICRCARPAQCGRSREGGGGEECDAYYGERSGGECEGGPEEDEGRYAVAAERRCAEGRICDRDGRRGLLAVGLLPMPAAPDGLETPN